MDPSFPPVLSCLRAAIPLSFVLLLRLCGGMPVAELAAFWCCPLRLLDDLHALLCRTCESAECEVAAGAGLWECSRVTKSVATKKFVREAVNHSGKRRTTIQKVYARRNVLCQARESQWKQEDNVHFRSAFHVFWALRN